MGKYIGIDLGTGSCKGLLCDGAGKILRQHAVTYPVYCTHNGVYSEQNPEDWYGAVTEILRVLSDGCADEVLGVGIAGQMHGLVMLDRYDRVIRPAILWNDGRSEKQTAYLNSLGILPECTGNIAFPGFTAPKILWVAENEPRAFEQTVRICLPKDYVAYRLTGEFTTDYSDASGMLLLDVKRKKWSERVLDVCGVGEQQLPRLCESDAAVGKLKPEFGLPNAVLCAGAGDNAASAVGTGTLRPGDCSISLGTSGTVFLPTDTFDGGCNPALHQFAHASGRYHLMGCILSAASCNSWWKKTVLGTDFSDPNPDLIGKNRVFFLPYLTGERCPHNDVGASGAFVGLRADTTQEAMSLAVLEGVAYALRDCAEAGNKKIDRAVLCGGGSVSPVWQSVIANVLGADIYLTETGEAAAFGASLLAMSASGAYRSVYDAADATVRKTLSVSHDSEKTRAYDSGYGIYKKLYPALKDVMR